ncbi:MAG: carboxypeptidase-like regulatory domain-containing protein [Cyclobacteriaceae bacterium]|nr:carboxypeptidase-like regulatory domain-containing protein [Cyclobacteriaceae bacterium]
MNLYLCQDIMKGFFKVLILLVAIGSTSSLMAQSQRRVIQLSGFVTDTATMVLPGVHVYVPKAGRGTPTSNAGFFTMPVLVGDSVVFSAVGYKRASYKVPDLPKESWTIFVELAPDVTVLGDAIVMGIPTEELFKEAVLAMNIPLDNNVDTKAMNAEMLALMARTTPMDGAGNYRYYIDQWSNSAGDKFRPAYNPFLNPLNWARFIRDLKKKKK